MPKKPIRMMFGNRLINRAWVAKDGKLLKEISNPRGMTKTQMRKLEKTLNSTGERKGACKK